MPLIACHLPQLFHLSIGWDHAMRAMGLSPQEAVHYGRSYVRTGRLDELGAMRTEALARLVYHLPKGRSCRSRLMRLLTALFVR